MILWAPRQHVDPLKNKMCQWVLYEEFVCQTQYCGWYCLVYVIRAILGFPTNFASLNSVESHCLLYIPTVIRFPRMLVILIGECFATEILCKQNWNWNNNKNGPNYPLIPTVLYLFMYFFLIPVNLLVTLKTVFLLSITVTSFTSVPSLMKRAKAP